ncbi:MAG TPA: hypothetical protein VFI46_13730 [Jiangellaceae bacterium]|nr:hypothetical protein [Jiangellaceae bacterium]
MFVSRIAMALGAVLALIGGGLALTPLGNSGQAASTVLLLGAITGWAGWCSRASVTIDEAWQAGYEAGTRRIAPPTGQVLSLERRRNERRASPASQVDRRGG